MAMRTQNEVLQASSPAQDPGQQQPAQLGARGGPLQSVTPRTTLLPCLYLVKECVALLISLIS